MHNVRALIAAGKTIDAIRILREEEGLSLVDAKRRVEDIAAAQGD
jgi:ribosomal protein L7/L12